MIYNIQVPTGTVSSLMIYELQLERNKSSFPILQIDRGSYIVEAQIQSGINFNPDLGVHSIQIGKYCSIAESVTFMIDLNHPYHNVAQGDLWFYKLPVPKMNLKHKGSIMIQNDVWIGHGVTILGGVTIHNGAVIAANSVVTKDVPPYAIVGGNPARVLGEGYRFSKEQIKDLLSIRWWNWNDEKLKLNANDFGEPIDIFIKKHIKEARKEWDLIEPLIQQKEKEIILFIPDLREPYPLWRRILREYFSKSRGQYELLIYILPDISEIQYAELIQFLEEFESCEAYITIQDIPVEDERSLFKNIDYFITTRMSNTVQWSEYADYYNVRMISGVDFPVFNNLN